MVALLLVGGFVAGDPVVARASSGKELVETILESSNASERRVAARELAEGLDPKPIRTLARKAASNERAADALTLIEERLVGRAATGKTLIRIRVVKTLAAIDTKAVASALAERAVDDRVRLVRNAAAAALGALKQSAPLVVDGLVAASVRAIPDDRMQAAIKRAVTSIGTGAIEPLVAAFAAGASAGDFDTAAQALGLLQAVEVRHGAAVTEIWPRVVEPLFAALATPNGPSAAHLLVEVGAPAVPRLIEIARLQIVVENPVEDPGLNAEIALIAMAARDLTLVAPLLQALDARDLALVADLMNFYIQLGQAGSEAVLIAALDSLGSSERAGGIALQFLDTGHQPLIDAAHSWAARHGFTVTGQPSGIVTWGNLGGDARI